MHSLAQTPLDRFVVNIYYYTNTFATNTEIFDIRKLVSLGYRVHGVICIILDIAILMQYQRVTDTHTHTYTQTHDDSILR